MDYKKYNALCGSLRQLAHKLSQLDPETDPLRKKLESELLEKLWRMGILKQSREQGAGLSKVEREVTVSALCRRRLAVFMVRSGMVETIKAVSLPCTRGILETDESECLLIYFTGCHFHRARPRPCRY
jgi:U3 small nucleolar ribonucleoprotein protein IMP3